MPLILFSAGIFILVVSLVAIFPDISTIPYAYAVIGILGMGPILVYAFVRHDPFFNKFFSLTLFFFPFALIMEIQAVRFGLWSFHNYPNYLAIITLFGAAFPVEEIIFWMTLGPVVAITYYELFADDGI